MNRRTLVAALLASGYSNAPGLKALATDIDAASTTVWEGPNTGLKVEWDDAIWEYSIGTQPAEDVDYISIVQAGGDYNVTFHAEIATMDWPSNSDFEERARLFLDDADQGDVETSPPILEWNEDDAFGYIFDPRQGDVPIYMCVEVTPSEIEDYLEFAFFWVTGDVYDKTDTRVMLDGISVNGRDPFLGISSRKLINAIADDLESR